MASEDHDWKEMATVHGATQAHDWVPLTPMCLTRWVTLN